MDSQVSNPDTPKGNRSGSRRSASTSKSSSAKKTASGSRRTASSAATGYSDSATRLLSKGKSALGSAYNWVEETASNLPKTARQIGVPDQRTVQNFVGEKPFIFGILGLGIGMAIGAMVPATGWMSHSNSQEKARSSTRKSSRRS